jgi:hypothetical protein
VELVRKGAVGQRGYFSHSLIKWAVRVQSLLSELTSRLRVSYARMATSSTSCSVRAKQMRSQLEKAVARVLDGPRPSHNNKLSSRSKSSGKADAKGAQMHGGLFDYR